MEIQALRFSEQSETVYHSIQCNIAEDFDLQQHSYCKLTFRMPS